MTLLAERLPRTTCPAEWIGKIHSSHLYLTWSVHLLTRQTQKSNGQGRLQEFGLWYREAKAQGAGKGGQRRVALVEMQRIGKFKYEYYGPMQLHHGKLRFNDCVAL
jgi:hypothetical protein